MKRALSLILAIMMVMAMLPSVAFATGGVDSGIRIKYDIAAAMAALDTEWESLDVNYVPFTEFNYELTNGFFQYVDSTSSDDTAGGSEHNYQGQHSIQLSSGKYIAFEVFIPVAGTYTMNMYNSEYDGGNSAAGINVYVNKDKVSTSEGHVGSYACYKEGMSSFTLVEAPNVIENIEISEAGHYIFTFKATASYGTVGAFELVSGDGSETVLTSMKASVDEEILIIGNSETTKVSVDSLYLNNGALADSGAYTVSYNSSDETVAKVDSSTGEVIAVSVGEATVTAVTENEAGTTIESSIDLAVVDGATIKYDIKKHLITDLGYKQSNYVSGQTPPSLTLTALTEDVTDGFYSYFGGNDSDGSRVKYYSSLQLGYAGAKVAFKINVPAAGHYNIVHDITAISPSNKNASRQNVDIGVYISKDEISTTSADYIGAVNAYGESYTEGEALKLRSGSVEFDEPGSYIITLKVDTHYGTGSPYAQINSFYLVGGTHDALMNGAITSTAASINVDEGETATVSAEGFLSSTTEATTAFTYSSSNEKVATVDAESGVVTPVSEGKATITATATDAEVANTLTTDITVTANKPGEAVTDTMVSFVADAEAGGTVTDKGEVQEVAIGNTVTVEATANEGYEFAYWRNASGKWLSSNATEEFTINTNTAVIAVFDKVTMTEEDTTVPVYFYNENGSLIEKKPVTPGITFNEAQAGVERSLTGHTFKEWSIAGDTVINAILRAVALYDADTTTYSVTVGGETAASGAYGTKVTVTGSDDFVCWKLGENIVSYDKEYSFLIWGDITLTEVTEGEAKNEPTIAINKSGDNYFIAYNVPTGYTLVEAGIVFADTGIPTIESFYSKASANTGSGQFTSKSGSGAEAAARGYVIFRDGDNNIRVIYAD